MLTRGVAQNVQPPPEAQGHNCLPLTHMWGEWVQRLEEVDSVYPYGDNKKRRVVNMYMQRRCSDCPATQEYLYDCRVSLAE